MGVVKLDEIRGLRLDTGAIVCVDCCTSEELNGTGKEGSFILDYEVDNSDDFYFCDRNGCRL
jgi:hypothetical protein